MPAGWKFIAQRVVTGEFIDLEVPFALSSNPRRDLSGPGGMSGTVEPEYARLRGPDGLPVLQEWSTALYAEIDGRIRWGGLIAQSSFDNGRHLVECVGFTGYPNGIPYLGARIRAGIEVPGVSPDAGRDRNNDGYIDYTTPANTQRVRPAPPPTYTDPIEAFDVIRRVWDEVQKYPYGDVGMQVDEHDSGEMLGKPLFLFAPDDPILEAERIKEHDAAIAEAQTALNEAQKELTAAKTTNEINAAKKNVANATWNLNLEKQALVAEKNAQDLAKRRGGYPQADPYELLWWEYPDCGAEIDSVAATVGFEYIEDHDWAPGGGSADLAGRPAGHPDYGKPAGKNRYGVPYESLGMDAARRPKGHSDFGQPSGYDKAGNLYPSGTSNGEPADKQIVHRLRLAHPRLGTRREDLSFVQGENIVNVAQPAYRGEEFANEVIGVGKGEGSKMLVSRIPTIDGRLRRVHIEIDKMIGSKARLDATIRANLKKRAQGLAVPMIEVIDHPNARIGSWNPGDDILVEVDVPWVGQVAIWHRIVSDELAIGNTAVLTLERAELFT